MKKFFSVLLKILKTIIAVPLATVLAILLIPVYAVMWVIILNEVVIGEIWELYSCD